MQLVPFFDDFARFVDTSLTGHDVERLNARYTALIHANRDVIKGARVLDIASHDGRFAFAALRAGADRVVGVEHDAQVAQSATENMRLYDVAPERYEFVVGDMFEFLREARSFDVVFCFGILYHVTDPMRLLTRIAELLPQTVIIDTNISPREAAVIELRNPMTGYPPKEGGEIECYPSRTALNAMLASFGWTYEYFDWSSSAMVEGSSMQDYRNGRRVTVLVDCQRPTVAADALATAAQEVLDRRRELRTQWVTITNVAKEHGIAPQTLKLLVRRLERERGLRRIEAPS
jgi:ubiquinone/menaquinone biosynthesis C-methylase UbiE